jgi:serine protease
VAASLWLAATAIAKPIQMPTIARSTANQKALNPPPPPCPQYGIASCTPVPEAFATTLPFPGNMAYYGGHVQTTPHLYLVYWGWGQQGAWPNGTTCSPADVTEGSFTATLACDADGAGKYMADWVDQLGGTSWAGSQTQYYETDSQGAQHHITNPTNQLAGIWVDDANPNTLPRTSLDNPAGSTNTQTVLAQEAARAVTHFGITDLTNSQVLIVQPPGLSDPDAVSQGYCAWHDMTYPGVEANVYNGIQPNVAFTDMPYALAINSGGSNLCGENAVNSGAAGKLDGFSIVLGHEIEETVTDPGAEDVVGTTPTYLGGWYDTVDANENADKCAWVGEPLITGFPGEPNVAPVPGAMGNTTGNKGKRFAVQSLWSNAAAGGAGWCAGAGTDLPA